MKKLIYPIIFILLICSVLAHQPRLVSSDEIEVLDPEISKAYYGELTGEPHTFIINSDKEFSIYLNLLIPGKESTHTVSARLLKGDEVLCVEPGERHLIKDFSKYFSCFLVKYPIDQKDKTLC